MRLSVAGQRWAHAKAVENLAKACVDEHGHALAVEWLYDALLREPEPTLEQEVEAELEELRP